MTNAARNLFLQGLCLWCTDAVIITVTAVTVMVTAIIVMVTAVIDMVTANVRFGACTHSGLEPGKAPMTRSLKPKAEQRHSKDSVRADKRNKQN